MTAEGDRACRRFGLRRLRAALLVLAGVFVSGPVLAARLALLIGNDAYRHVPALVNATADARAMGRALERDGFEVTLLLDVGERDFKAGLRAFKARVNGGDDVVVFYAGHGVQVGNANFLLPTDIHPDNDEQVRDESIPLQRILDDLDERRARFALAIVDACRDNPFRRSGRNIGGRGLAPTAPATGQMVIYSAGTGQQALDRLGDDDKEANGIFTRVLLKELEKPGVSADRLIRNVRTEVARMARQVRHDQVPAIYDQALGEFYFKLPPKLPEPVLAPTAETQSRPDGAVVVPLRSPNEMRFANEDRDFGVAPTTRAKRSPYNTPTPVSIPGGQVIRTVDLIERLKRDPKPIVIDVNNSSTRLTVPGAWWLPSGGEASFYGADRTRFEEALKQVTQGDKSRPVVFLCVSSTCWLSYNAALLAIELGYAQVLWFRGGTMAWHGASQELQPPQTLH